MGAAKSDSKRKRQWDGEPLVLFVEGYSDLLFYAELMEEIGFGSQLCFIQDLGGKGRSKLFAEATLLLKPDNLAKLEAVAVLLDADDNPEGTFLLARNAMRDAVGVDIQRAGEWLAPANRKTRFGVFVVGGPDQKGEVESLAWAAWSEAPANAPLRACVESFVDCARQCVQKWRSDDKIRIGTVLSVLNEDDPRLGPGARAKVFDFKAAQFRELCQFLRRMRTSTADAAF